MALIQPGVANAHEALRNSTVFSGQRLKYSELEYTMTQMVDVALRSLSPAINDPLTAISVLERLGASLCELANVPMPGGATLRNGKVAVLVPRLDYAVLLETLFQMIRQKSAGNAFVLSKLIDVISAVTTCERDPDRLSVLEEQAGLVLVQARKVWRSPQILTRCDGISRSSKTPLATIGMKLNASKRRGIVSLAPREVFVTPYPSESRQLIG